MCHLDSYTPTSGSAEFHIDHYDLELDYKIRPNRLTGHAVLHGRVLDETSSLTLDLRGLKVRRVLVNNTKIQFKQTHTKLVLDSHFQAGEAFIVQIHYSGKPGSEIGTWGDVGWEELTDGVLVAGQPTGAATWFPCNDHPSHKATYRCTVRVDSDYTAIGNGVLTHKGSKGRRTAWTWESRQPLATYLATVQIGQYTQGRIDNAGYPSARVPLWLACGEHLRQQAQDTLATQHAMMSVFERHFGQYPFDSYGVVVTDDALDMPLESQPLSIFGSNHLASGWETERLLAHELAHQWFGNSLTVERWSDIWLHEGFACYAEWLWSEESGNASLESHAHAAHAQLASLPQDIVLADPGGHFMFDDRVYQRGALTLHALRSFTGADTFSRILQSWTTEHRHGTVSTAAFLTHVGLVAGRRTMPLLRDWLFQPVLPDLP